VARTGQTPFAGTALADEAVEMDKFAESFHGWAEPDQSDGATELRYELHFDSLFDNGRAFRFPCDALGRVALDALPARQRQSLERVMNMVGRDYAAPRLVTLTG
jgi:hypothetical protein